MIFFLAIHNSSLFRLKYLQLNIIPLGTSLAQYYYRGIDRFVFAVTT